MDLNKKILKRVLAGTLATASILPITKAEEDVNVPNSENIVIEETEKNGKTESKSWFEANKKNLGIGAVAAAVATFVGVGLCKLFSGSEEKSSQEDQIKQQNPDANKNEEKPSQAEQPKQKEEPSQAEQPKQQNSDVNEQKEKPGFALSTVSGNFHDSAAGIRSCKKRRNSGGSAESDFKGKFRA